MAPSNNKRIAKNTLMLYSRQILILLVSLYTVRIVLDVLGIEDYGIYNVVGGVVALFSFLSGSMASATQRFFSFAIGQEDSDKLNKVFSVNLLIYIAIAIIAFILLETIGTWFINQQLKIPPERFEAARWVYHFSVLTFIATIFTAPFMAIIIAHEDMQIYAYISVVEAGLKLAIVFLLMRLSGDKLEVYGFLLFAVSFVNALFYVGICVRKYSECQFRRFYWDKRLLQEIISFTGWTLLGQITIVLRNQGVTILLNQVFTPVVVAARAIASSITSRINIFSSNFNIGLYPPIIKSYAANEKNNMFSLIFNGAKITFFLMWIFSLPLFLEMDTILSIWLKTPPEGAVLFTRLALVEVLINSISLPITTAARAPGKMRTYELILGSLNISIFLIAWLVLKMGGAAYSVYIVAIAVNFVMLIVRLFVVRTLLGLSMKSFFIKVIIPVLAVILVSSLFSTFTHLMLPKGLVFTGTSILTSMIFSSISMYFLGLNKSWRRKVNEIIWKRIHQII